MESKQNQSTEKMYVVKDVGGQLKCIFGMIFLGLIGMFFLNMAFKNEIEFWTYMNVALICGGIGAMVFYRLKVILPGIVLNLETDEMIYPGGSNSLNNLGDYIKLDWWIQYWKRYTINLKGISEIKSINYPHVINNTRVYKYFIRFTGIHGSSEVEFAESGKRDELYNAIRMHNRMGMPVFKS